MCVVVAQAAQSVKLFLASSVPQTEFDVCVIEEDVVDVVLEHSRLVHGREVASREDVEERRLPTRAIAAAGRNMLTQILSGQAEPYSKTSFRDTVLVPPQSGIVVKSWKSWKS